MGILQDGFIYVSYGYRLAKLNKNGAVVDTLILPTGCAEPQNTSYNGFNFGCDSHQIPGNNTHDYAVWRNAATGQELARSPLLPAMTQGTMIQPYYHGHRFFEGQSGTLIKLMPRPL
jgi:hypothetical protein